MAQVQLSGLASGFDWKSMVDQLIALDRVPQDKLRTQKSTNDKKLTAFATLRTKLTALQDAAKNLTTDNLFSKRTIALANADLTWTASAANGANAGEFTFDVTKLATRTVRTGATDRATSLNDSSDVSELLVSDLRLATPVTAGVFTINGAKIEVEDTDTLEDVFAKIADATNDAVTASYNATTDRATLTSSSAITLGSGGDTSNFLYAFKLYNTGATSISSASPLGTIALDEPLSASGLATSIPGVDAEGDGSFVVNGVTIEFNVGDDSIRDVMNRVNSSAAGATLAYDGINDRFTLTNKNTGDVDLPVSEAAGGFLAALGLAGGASVARGDNAEFSVNGGGTVVSASNVLSPSAHGVKGLTVTATSLGEQTVTVGNDSEELETGILAFISAFNDVQKFIDEQTKVTVGADGKVTAALLADNREMTDIARQLRSRVFNAVPGVSGSIRRLETLGIDFEGSSSQLAVRDQAALTEALTNNLNDVSSLFTTASTGLTASVDTYVAALTTTKGSIDTQETTLDRQNASLDNQIADLERHLEAERTRLEASFIRMEEAQSLLQSQLSALQNTLNIS